MSIGLVLSGGGAKGLAHIGVIEALNDFNIPIDYISGSSSGSVVASLYAAGYSPREILDLTISNAKKIIDFDKSVGFKLMKTVISKKISIRGFVKGEQLERTLRFVLNQKKVHDIQDVKIPLVIPIVALKTGEVVYYSNSKILKDAQICEEKTKENVNDINEKNDELGEYDDHPSCVMTGDLADIVRASCSFPGVFTPKKIDNVEYIDGGVRVNAPVKVLQQMGATKTIVVSFDCNKNSNVSINNFIGISYQAFNLLSHSSNECEQELADVNLRLCINNVSLLDFSKARHLVQRGYNIVAKNIDEIKKRLELL